MDTTTASRGSFRSREACHDHAGGDHTVGLVNIAEDVVTGPVKLEGSAVRVPDKPGLGVVLDEQKIRRVDVG